MGCVDIEDVLSAEDYKKKIPEELQESESEFVFIGKNPRQLVIPFSITGRPYICNFFL